MITTKADVKILAALYSLAGNGAPETSTTGQVGDIYLDIDETSETYGDSWELTAISEGVYTWTSLPGEDARIILLIGRAEQDYLNIRGRAFDVVDDSTAYPDGSDLVAAEMVCYLMGVYEGRGRESESAAGRSMSYERKIGGYPISIVGQIDRYVEVG